MDSPVNEQKKKKRTKTESRWQILQFRSLYDNPRAGASPKVQTSLYNEVEPLK